ncbi:unnamed protein product [Adineta steineri]|uniref:Uncharacterized protein n=1 Tax=Adineta steineri TaxID=433720 RepID=A0A815CJM2_9BILA|nr:unnamed protein product [Adineta steineri]CAF1204215.1 unnamed protein product [Adineta steineri]CAF1288182.1 unnamed protein product [Adineta steineri]CAF1465904.1 unnamed protein product [Adineta steineri]CAF1634431.1 unnamed protein product [Adineta steineri]
MVVVAPVNPNAVVVALVTTGCLKSEFDSTYPIHLNGIIRQDEFQQSIHNINQTISSRKSLLILGLICIICTVGGMILFISGSLTASKLGSHGFPILLGIGLGVFVLGMLTLSCGCFIVQTRRMTRMRQAVANESIKYSTRTPTPCSWRLDATRAWAGGYGRGQRIRLVYHLIIEIGHSNLPQNGNLSYQFNQAVPQSTVFSSQQNNMPPPPYYDQSAAGFCSQCGIPRESITSKFCSSCGHPFHY